MNNEVSFLEALAARYGSQDDKQDTYDFNVGVVSNKEGSKASAKNTKKWELVGMEDTRMKQADHRRLHSIVLKYAGITIAEKDSERAAQQLLNNENAKNNTNTENGVSTVINSPIAAAGLIRATEVDLSGNDKLSIYDIGIIVAALPRLELVQLNGIPLLSNIPIINSTTNGDISEATDGQVGDGAAVTGSELPVTCADGSTARKLFSLPPMVWPTLKQLVLNRTGIQSLEALRNLKMVNLEEIHLDMNKMTSLGLSDGRQGESGEKDESLAHSLAFQGFPNVHTISLAQNNFFNWGIAGKSTMTVDEEESGRDESSHINLLHLAFPKIKGLLVCGNKNLPDLPAELLTIDFATSQGATASHPTTTTSEVDNTPHHGIITASPIEQLRRLAGLLGQLSFMDISDNEGILDHTVTFEVLRTFGGIGSKEQTAPLVKNDDSGEKNCGSSVSSPFQDLTTLRVSYTHLFLNNKEKYPVECIARNITIASVPSLTTLNRAPVRPKERADAEIYYLRRAMGEYELASAIIAAASTAASGSSSSSSPATIENNDNHDAGETSNENIKKYESQRDKLMKEYPLFNILRDKYKRVVLIADGGTGAKGGALGDMLLQVTFCCDAHSNNNKKIPGLLTVGKLKALARTIYPHVSAYMEVSFWNTTGCKGSKEAVIATVVLECDERTVAFYGVTDGSYIKIRDMREEFGKE